MVPAARCADRRAGRPAEPVHLVDAAGEPGYQAGYAPTGGPDLAPGFWKLAGMVWLQGSASGPGGTIFTLPEGYRPAGDAHFGTVTVEADGDVTAPGDVSLDGIAFRVG